MKIDCHVHMVGNGLHGSGSYLNLNKTFYKIAAGVMLRSIGLPYRTLKEGDLEKLYLDYLISNLEDSNLDAVLLLAQEQVYSEDGKAQPQMSNMYIPNDVVLGIYKQNPKFLPAVSIHPARPDAIDELQRCKELGAKVMKCLPLYQQINCSNPRYRAFWQTMAELKMPLLAHTGDEKALPAYMPELASPEYLRLPLECGVNVIAAHGASTYNTLVNDFRPILKAMLREFPNLYVDNSGMHMLFRAMNFKVFFHEEFEGRVIHGSDLPIPVFSFWAYLHKQISKQDHLKCKAVKSPLGRDVQIKKALGFKEETFSLLSTLIS